MTQFLHTLFNMSLTAAFVAVIVLLLRLLLKGRAARQMVCLLWLIVFARLLIPVTLQSPVSLVPDMELSDPSPVVSTEPEAVPTQPVNTSPVQGGMIVAPPVVTGPVQNPGTATIPPNVSAPEPVVSAPIVEEPPAVETPFPWAAVFTVVWAVGVAAMLVYGVGSYLSIRRKLRFAIRTKEGWWEDPHLRSPFILGLLRPKIYLPCHMTPCARQFILCHERAHIRRGDHIIKPICWLALALHWFNPLAWAAFLLLSRDIEVACDEKVLRQLGSEVKADYSATLLALATSGRFPAPTPLAFGEGDAKTRIKGVLSFKKPALWVTIAAVVVAVVAAVCLLTDPVDKFDPNDYTTLDEYPGLYFETVVDEAAGGTTMKAYALEEGKPVLVAGWMDHPADNLVTLIQPDGEEKVLLASLWEVTAQYEQYLVDYMMEQDEGWAQRYIEESDDLITILSVSASDLQSSGQIGDQGKFHGGVAYTPEENLLFCWEGTAQVLPRWTPFSPDAHTVKVYPYDRSADGTDRLDILWTGKDGTLAVSSVPGGLPTYTGDALITYIWDGETWTAHDSLDHISNARKPVSFDADKQLITVEYDPNARTNSYPNIAHITPGMIQRSFPIPEKLGRAESISISGQAQISRREDGDYDLTYAVFAMPEGKTSDDDWVHVLDVTAIMKWNDLTEEFDIVFTGAEDAGRIVIGEGTLTYPVALFTVTPLAESIKDGHFTQFRLTCGENSTIFSGKATDNDMRAVDGTYTADLNGDGVQEIVVALTTGYGTGFLEQELHVFDSATLEEYPADGLAEELMSRFTFTSDEDNFYMVADGFSAFIPKEEIGYDYLLDNIFIGTVTRFVVEDGKLYCTFGCCVGDFAVYYGELWVELELADGVLTPSRITYIDPDGAETGQLTTLASLPEEDVWLYADQDGNFTMQAYGHYGPVTILNDLKDQLNLSTISDFQKATVTNLSGPDFETIYFTMKDKGGTTPLSYSLMWNEEQNVWDQCPYVTALSSLPRDIVTPETYPTNPEWYYKVAEDGSYTLYARNHGAEVLLQYGNFSWTFDHDAHSTRWSLPTMKMLDDETVAVISEVNTGTGVGVDELVVYDATLPVATDYLYDWRDLAAGFNRSNTLTYDKESNSLTLDWNGSTYNTGRLGEDLSTAYGLADGFTGALIATGEIIRFTANGDGTFTARMETSIGRGNKGDFYNSGEEWFWRATDSANHYYPLSIGITGLDLTWTVRFTGEGFEASEPFIQSRLTPPTPTADMFGLDELHAALFDAARVGYFKDHTSEQESPRAVLPIVTVLDRYEQDGKLHVICCVGYHSWYYDAEKNQLENTPGSEITYIRAVLAVNDDSSYTLEDVIYPSVNTGYSTGIQEVFKDRPDTYAKYKANTLEPISSFPEWDEMLRAYQKATGLTLKP